MSAESHLLIIDDDAHFAGELARRFRQLGVQHVEIVTDATKAVGAVLSRHWDGITIDLSMPDIAGPILLRMLRDVSPGVEARCWYLTAHTSVTAPVLVGLAKETGRPVLDKGARETHRRISYAVELCAVERHWAEIHRQSRAIGDVETEHRAATQLARIVRDRQSAEEADHG